MFKAVASFVLRLTCLLTFLANVTACSPKDPAADTTAYLAHHVMMPAYQHWQEMQQGLALATQEHCNDHKNSTLHLKAQFLNTLTAWNNIQSMLIGPLAEVPRALRIQFWPDAKNLIAKQVDGFLNAQPNPSLKDVTSGSILLQGLGAYEYLLFDAQAAKQHNATHRCALAVAIMNHQQQLATRVLQLWQMPMQGLAMQLQEYPNHRWEYAQAALQDLVQAQLLALKMAQEKLALPLEDAHQAEAWRTEGSLEALAAALIGLEQMWQGNGEQGLRALLPKAHASLAHDIDLNYAKIGEALQDLEAHPLSFWLSTEEGKDQLRALQKLIRTLHGLYQNPLSGLLAVK